MTITNTNWNVNVSDANWNVNVSDANWNVNVSDANWNVNENNTLQSQYNWPYLVLFLPVLIGTLGNVLVCLSISLDKRLRNFTNYFLLSLAVADLLVCVVAMPLDVIKRLNGAWPFGWQVCTFYISSGVLSCAASINHMCFISCCRYLGIRNPLKARTTSRKTTFFKITFVWFLSMATTGPIIVLAVVDTHNVQTEPGNCGLNNRYFLVFSSLFSFYIPIMIMVTSYVLAAQLLQKKTKFCQPLQIHPNANQKLGYRNQSTSSNGQPAQDSIPSRKKVELTNSIPKSFQLVTSFKPPEPKAVHPAMIRVLSGGRQLKSEQKASKVMGLIFFTFIICWTPFFVLNIIFAAWSHEQFPGYLIIISLWLGFISSTINPFIYTIFNRKFKTAFWKILSCKCNSFKTNGTQQVTNETSKSNSRTSIDQTVC